MNIRLWQFLNGYFPVLLPPSAGQFGPYWSLSLEEQFYLCIPMLIFLSGRRRIAYVLAGLVALQLTIFRPPPTLLWFFRSDALLLGVLLALSMDSPIRQNLEPVWLRRCPWVGNALFAIVLCGYFSATKFSTVVGTGGLALLAAGFVWIASYDRGYLMPDGWLKSGLMWIGTRSYSIYLWHIPVVRILLEIRYRFVGNAPMQVNHYAPFTLLAFLTVCMAADVTYRFVETPMRRVGRRVADRIDREPETAPTAVPVTP
jgi:peptidoglycan/LPS O-acetylase OafA/YrhL